MKLWLLKIGGNKGDGPHLGQKQSGKPEYQDEVALYLESGERGV